MCKKMMAEKTLRHADGLVIVSIDLPIIGYSKYPNVWPITAYHYIFLVPLRILFQPCCRSGVELLKVSVPSLLYTAGSPGRPWEALVVSLGETECSHKKGVRQ